MAPHDSLTDDPSIMCVMPLYPIGTHLILKSEILLQTERKVFFSIQALILLNTFVFHSDKPVTRWLLYACLVCMH
jgi:hypothetical protein